MQHRSGKNRSILSRVALSVLPTTVALANTSTDMSLFSDHSGVFIRQSFNDQYDLLHRMRYNENGLWVFKNVALFDRQQPLDPEHVQARIAAAPVLHACFDDNSSSNFGQAGSLGANHGYCLPFVITDAKLGVQDAGTEWIDAATNRFFFIKPGSGRPIDGTARPSGSDKGYYFIGVDNIKQMIQGNALKKAGNTTARVEIKHVFISQMYPFVKNVTNTFLLDGKKAVIPALQAVKAHYVDLVTHYEIPNPYVAFRGKYRIKPEDIADEASFTRYLDRLPGTTSHNIIYRYLPNNQILIDYSLDILEDIEYAWFVFDVLGAPLNAQLGPVYAYVPQVRPEGVIIGSTLRDLRHIADYSNFAEKSTTLASDLFDAPPNRSVIFLTERTAHPRDNFKYAFAFGYDMTFGVGTPEARKTNARPTQLNYWNVQTGLKSYPFMVYRSVTKGETFHCRAYRKYFTKIGQSPATCAYAADCGDYCLLFIDLHKETEKCFVPVPADVVGKTIVDVPEKTDSLTLFTDGRIPAAGIAVSVSKRPGDTAAHGYVTLKVK